MRWHIGAMTFASPGWDGTFYPDGLPRSRRLAHYATRFDAIELNATFHAMPTPERVRRWRGEVGDGVRFAVKAFRGITHDAPLAEAGPLLTEFLGTIGEFGPALGPVLLQLPPEVTVRQFDGLASLLESAPAGFRFAVEFRSADWFGGETFDLLKRHGAAVVAADLDGYPESRAIVPTADFLYVRLLGRHGRFPDESRERFDPTPRLIEWHDRIAAAADEAGVGEAWVAVNDDFAGHAPATARRLAALAGLPGRGGSVKQRKLFEL